MVQYKKDMCYNEIPCAYNENIIIGPLRNMIERVYTQREKYDLHFDFAQNFTSQI